MNNLKVSITNSHSYLTKSRILYKISFLFIVIDLIYPLFNLVKFFIEYRSLGFIDQDLTSNVLWLSNLTEKILLIPLALFIIFLIIRNKLPEKRTNNIAAITISVVACYTLIILIDTILLRSTGNSVFESFNFLYQINKLIWIIIPTIKLIAIALFVVSYINEKLNASPRKYFKIILTSVILLIGILSPIISILRKFQII